MPQDLPNDQIAIVVTLPAKPEERQRYESARIHANDALRYDAGHFDFVTLVTVGGDVAAVSVIPPKTGICPVPVDLLNDTVRSLLQRHTENMQRAWQAYHDVCQIMTLPDDDQYSSIEIRFTLNDRGQPVGTYEIMIPKDGYRAVAPGVMMEEGRLKRFIRNALESTNADGGESELPGERRSSH